MRQLRFEQRVDQDWSTSPCMEDQVVADTRERRIIHMDPTMVLAQQRMHVGESTHEGADVSLEKTRARQLRHWRSAPTSRRRKKTANHSDNNRNYFRTEQSATACR